MNKRSPRPIRALLVCHSCSPEGGSEARMSWRWVIHLALAGVHVTVLVNRADPTAPVDPRTAPLPPGIPDGCTPEFVAVTAPTWWRRLPIVVYTALDYQGWQRRALAEAMRLHAARPFDVVHHLSWASIHHGTRLSGLGVPFVLGPVGGGTISAAGYRECFPDSWRYERLRSRLVRSIGFNPMARQLVRRSARILASNPETAEALERLGATDVDVMLDDGVDPDELRTEPVDQSSAGPLRVLWISRIMERKALGMALEAVAQAARSVEITMTVIGDGEHRFIVADRLAELSATGLVDDRGWLDQTSVDEAFDHHDVLLFNSVRDNGSAPLHAASSRGVPAIVIDHQGPGAITSDDWAVRIPPSNTDETTADIARALVELAGDRDRRVAMGWAALAAGRRNIWPERAATMAHLYAEVIDEASSGPVAGRRRLRFPGGLRGRRGPV